ncbi:hypothetical protein IJ847_01565, partial [Candidatus Saccharibacteria bacterium]|nr:hypothetical protein [Candidatus Saccharibacteria bacterium]
EGDENKNGLFSRSGRGLRKRFIGNLLREAFKVSYEKQAFEAIKKANEIYDDPNLSDDERRNALADIKITKWRNLLERDWTAASATETMKYDFVARHTEQAYDSLIHSKVGEKFASYSVHRGDDGELHVYERLPGQDEQETTDLEKVNYAVGMRDIVQRYAKGEIADRAAFLSEVNHLREICPNANANAEVMTNNFFAMAEAAKMQYDAMSDCDKHADGIERLMKGFAIVNAETRSNIRTEIHKSKCDEVIEKLKRSKVGRFVPAGALTAATGVAGALLFGGESSSNGVVQRALKVVFPASVLASGMIAGVKERQRAQEDITKMRRDLARGMNVRETETGRRYAKNRELYEATYDMIDASDATDSLNGLLNKMREGTITDAEKDGMKGLFSAMYFARELSDDRNVDLIAYSNDHPENIPDERLRYDIALARAEVMMRDNGIDVQSLRSTIGEGANTLHALEESIDEKDKVACKLRRKMARRAGVKAAATTFALGTVASEIRAAFDPNMTGVIDRLRGVKDTDGAGHTILEGTIARFERARAEGWNGVGAFIRPLESGGADISHVANYRTGVTKNEAQQILQQHPDYKMVQVGQRPDGTFTDVTLGDYVSQRSEQIHIGDENWLNNGTAEYDLSEKDVFFTETDKWFARLRNNPFNSNMTIDPKLEAANGRLVWVVRTNDIDGNNGTGFLLPAAYDQASGNFVMSSSADPTLRDVAESFAFDRFHLGVDLGLDSNGVRNIASIATTSGHGFDGSEIISHTQNMEDIFNVTRTVTEHIDPTTASTFNYPLFGLNGRNELAASRSTANRYSGGVPIIEEPSNEPVIEVEGEAEEGTAEEPIVLGEEAAVLPEEEVAAETEVPVVETPAETEVPVVETPAETEAETAAAFEAIKSDSLTTNIDIDDSLLNNVMARGGTAPDAIVLGITRAIINNWNAQTDDARRRILRGEDAPGVFNALIAAGLIELD